MYDRTPQEELLVIEALVEYHADQKDVQPERACRAWAIAAEIAAIHGLDDTMTDTVFNTIGGVVVALWGLSYLTDVTDAITDRLEYGR